MSIRFDLLFVLWLASAFSGCVVTKHETSLDSQHTAAELIDQGTLWMRSGELDRAQGAFEAAWQLAKLPAALDGQGCIAFRRGHWRQAETLFIEAYQVDPRYSTSISNLALLYKKHGLSDAARRLYLEAIRRDPKNFRARNNFGVLLSDIEESQYPAKAELLRAAALRRDPLIESNLRSISEE